MGQKRRYKQYSKEEAVAQVQEQSYSVPEAAKTWGKGDFVVNNQSCSYD